MKIDILVKFCTLFCIKVSFGIGHPPPTHQIQSICMQEGSRVPNLQTEFNYLDSFKSYCIFSDFVVPMWSPLSPRHPHSPQKVPMWSPHPPWLWSPLSPPHVAPRLHPMLSPCHRRHPHIVPVIPTSSLHHLEGPHIILNPPDTHPTHPGVGPQISKNAIRFELIEIF